MNPRELELPDGWELRRSDAALLIAERSVLPALLTHGLERSAAWDEAIAGSSSHGGRGGSACLQLAPGLVARIKPLLRGGLVGRLRPAGFADLARPLSNLRLPLEALRRGVRTPAPLALLCLPVRGGWRAWLALRDVPDGLDLGRALERHGAAAVDLDAVTAAIRAAHDAGLEHRDLNVGNLLLAPPTGESRCVWLLDLDGARLHDAALPFSLRQRGLRRLERSVEKTRAAGAATPMLRDRLYESYAAGDVALAERLGRGRGVGRALIRLHAARWGRGR